MAYHSDMTPDARACSFENWESGAVRVLATTSVCSRGLNAKGVTKTIHVQPHGPIQLAQEQGRGGREAGAEATSIIAYHHTHDLQDTIALQRVYGNRCTVFEFAEPDLAEKMVASTASLRSWPTRYAYCVPF